MASPPKPETFSVPQILNLLSRTRLLPAEEVRALYARWRAEAGPSVDHVPKFRQWLVSHRFVTDYQAERLVRGQTDHYFLNDYRLMEQIGAGRMAGVYRAVHRLGATVAVKVLPPSKAKIPVLFERFQREARLAARLKHPNVVRTFQIGKSEGLYYLVMEYLEGETLKELLEKRGRLPPGDAVRLIYQALLGLQHIHEQSLIHRDLSPANLMLVPAAGKGPVDPATATLKILDIGLGREVFDEDAPVGAKDLTADGAILGTPEYLSPEQGRDSHAADIRSDIYSLGCVLFNCLAGRPPFMDKQLVHLLVRHAKEPPPPLAQFNPQVPDGLQQIVNWMLAKDPGQRYPTPERAAQAMEMYLASTQPLPKQETNVPMQDYLQWLSTQSEVVAWEPLPGEAPVATIPVTARPSPVPLPQSSPAPPVSAPVSLSSKSLGALWTWQSRDWQVAGLGAAALLAVQVFLWIMWAMVR